MSLIVPIFGSRSSVQPGHSYQSGDRRDPEMDSSVDPKGSRLIRQVMFLLLKMGE